MEKTLNIYQRLAKAQAELRYLEKDMIVGTGYSAYKAVSDQQVTLAVKGVEELCGIVSYPINQELMSNEVQTYLNPKGEEKQNFVVVIRMTTRFVNIDNPQDYIDVVSFGRGVDSQDKDFGKASTYARKYALLNTYKIATGDDPDKDASQEMSRKRTPAVRQAYQPLPDERYFNCIAEAAKGTLSKTGRTMEEVFIQLTHAGREQVEQFRRDVEELRKSGAYGSNN